MTSLKNLTGLPGPETRKVPGLQAGIVGLALIGPVAAHDRQVITELRPGEKAAGQSP
jgi:hypothetical protein